MPSNDKVGRAGEDEEVGRAQAIPGRDGSQALARKGSNCQAVGQWGRRLLPLAGLTVHGCISGTREKTYHSCWEGPDQICTEKDKE